MSTANPQTTVQPGFFSYDRAAAYLGLSRSTLEKLVATKRLEPRRLGRRVLFAVGDLDALLEVDRGKATC